MKLLIEKKDKITTVILLEFTDNDTKDIGNITRGLTGGIYPWYIDKEGKKLFHIGGFLSVEVDIYDSGTPITRLFREVKNEK